jgi:hypothetical protein
VKADGLFIRRRGEVGGSRLWRITLLAHSPELSPHPWSTGSAPMVARRPPLLAMLAAALCLALATAAASLPRPAPPPILLRSGAVDVVGLVAAAGGGPR